MKLTRRGFARLLLALVGFGAIGWLVRYVGVREVGGALKQATPWLPLVLALEGLRLLTEMALTRSILRADTKRMPFAEFLRTHLLSNALCTFMPAGRLAAETIKATLMAPYVSGPKAATMGASIQSLTLFANGLMSIFGAAAAAFAIGASWMSIALVLNALLCIGLALAVQILVRSHRLMRWVSRFPRFAPRAEIFRELARAQAFFPAQAGVIALVNRVLQALELGVLGYALGLPFSFSMVGLLQGINLLASTVGDFMPAQLGVLDAAFAASAQVLETTAAVAVSIAMLNHCVQLVWVVIGALVPLFWQPARRAIEEELKDG